MSEFAPTINSYFEKIGTRRYRNLLQFWSAMDEEYGMTRARELESAYRKLEAGDEQSFYSTIFEQYDVSIAFTCLRLNLYESFLVWLLSQELAAKLVVDAGCGNGVLTCFLASHFPESEIVGFDINMQAIECAQKLAGKLELKNVQFRHSDCLSIRECLDGRNADLVVSVASLGLPDSPGDEPRNMDLRERFLQASESIRSSDLVALVNLLADEGRLVSFDKVPTIGQQLDWCAAIQNAGLSIDLDASRWVSYEDIEADRITLPIVVARKGDGQCEFNDLISFLVKREVQLSQLSLEDNKEVLAELVFSSINPRQFVCGARAEYTDGAGTYWYEVWRAGPTVLSFEHTNHGYRGLKFHASCDIKQAMVAFEKWTDQTRSYAEIVELKQPDITFGIVERADSTVS